MYFFGFPGRVIRCIYSMVYFFASQVEFRLFQMYLQYGVFLWLPKFGDSVIQYTVWCISLASQVEFGD